MGGQATISTPVAVAHHDSSPSSPSTHAVATAILHFLNPFGSVNSLAHVLSARFEAREEKEKESGSGAKTDGTQVAETETGTKNPYKNDHQLRADASEAREEAG